MATVDTLILRNATNSEIANMAYGIVPLRYDSFSTSKTFGIVNTMIWAFFLVSILLPTFTLIGKFMDDKANRMRDTLKMMGMKDFAYFSGYFITYSINQFIIAFGCPLIICFGVASNTDYFVLALFIFLCGLAIFPFSIIIW